MKQLDLQWLPREPGLQIRLLYGEMIRRHYSLFHEICFSKFKS